MLNYKRMMALCVSLALCSVLALGNFPFQGEKNEHQTEIVVIGAVHNDSIEQDHRQNGRSAFDRPSDVRNHHRKVAEIQLGDAEAEGKDVRGCAGNVRSISLPLIPKRSGPACNN